MGLLSASADISTECIAHSKMLQAYVYKYDINAPTM